MNTAQALENSRKNSTLNTKQWEEYFDNILHGVDVDAVSNIHLGGPQPFESGYTSLHLAALLCDYHYAKKLLSLGADVNKRAAKHGKESALYLTLSGMYELPLREGQNPMERILVGQELVKYLLQVGADPNIILEKRIQGPLSPLHSACLAQDMKTCELLLEYGANPELKDKTNKRPVDYLNKSTQTQFNQLVKKYANKPRPPVICKCGSGKLFTNCHGQKGGVVVADDEICPCSRGRLYGKCCKKKGIKWVNENWQYGNVVTVANQQANTVIKKQKRMEERLIQNKKFSIINP
jgi:hypothetical protein